MPVFSGDLGFNAFGHAREFAERTIADFTRAAEVNPTYPIPISNRALLYEQTKQYDLAFADYDKLISLPPDDTYYRERKAALLDKFAPEPEPIILKSRSPSAPVTAPLEVEGEPLQPAPSPGARTNCGDHCPQHQMRNNSPVGRAGVVSLIVRPTPAETVTRRQRRRFDIFVPSRRKPSQMEGPVFSRTLQGLVAGGLSPPLSCIAATMPPNTAMPATTTKAS